MNNKSTEQLISQQENIKHPRHALFIVVTILFPFIGLYLNYFLVKNGWFETAEKCLFVGFISKIVTTVVAIAFAILGIVVMKTIIAEAGTLFSDGFLSMTEFFRRFA